MKNKYIIFVLFLLFYNHSFGQLKYYNPILSGFYPDPSICRVGNDYYIVASSFAYFPGLPVFHSTDLVNWKQLGHAIDRNEQLDQSGAGVSRGLFAPTIRYNKGLYYIICTQIDKGGNFIITAKNPSGPWSNPIWLPGVSGIDPSLYFEGDRTYIVYNSDPPDHKPLYDGHRTIKMIEYNINQQKIIGSEKLLVNGGVDISKKPVWIEAPHLYKINDWYYLMCAEGGTAYNHSEVIFRSKTLDGPYIPGPSNPILTQRDLDPQRKNPVTTTGHADLVKTPDGKWYAVFLGCRPYEDDYYNTGRETFLTPVSWKDGWPVINPGYKEVQFSYPVPFLQTEKLENDFSGNFTFHDDFNNAKLNNRFVFLRNPTPGLFRLEKGNFILRLKQNTISQKDNPAFIGFRQSHLKCEASAQLSFKALASNEKAGLIIFQNQHSYYFLCKSIKNNNPVIELYKAAKANETTDILLAAAGLPTGNILDVKIIADGDTYSFYYSTDGKEWTLLKDNIDAKFLSTKEAGGFVGAMFGLYATSNGAATDNQALFNWFNYKGNDDIYKKQE